MRVLAWMMATFLCLAPAGCALFDKNKTSSGNSSNARNTTKPDDPLVGTRPTAQLFPQARPGGRPAAPAPLPGSTLAGKVINPGRPSDEQGNAVIRWACLEDKDDATAREVTVNPEGYFVIANVKPGGKYKLVARAKNGDRMLAGVVYATAPDLNVVIPMDPKFANADTPPMPPGPGVLDKQPTTEKPEKDKSPAKTSAADLETPLSVGFISVPGARGPARDEPQALPVVKVPFPSGPDPKPGWSPGSPNSSPPHSSWFGLESGVG